MEFYRITHPCVIVVHSNGTITSKRIDSIVDIGCIKAHLISQFDDIVTVIVFNP